MTSKLVSSSNMKILEELTSELPHVTPMRHEGAQTGGWQEYRMIKGRSKARNLLSIPGKISVAQWWNSEDSDFPEHAHEEKEFVLVFEGEMHLFVEGKKYVLLPGNSRYIGPGMRHNAHFPVGTNYIACTVPDSEDWPD